MKAILCVFGNCSHRCFNRWHRWTPLKRKSMGKVLHIYGKTKALHHCGNYCTLKMFILHSGFFSKVRRCKSWKLKIKWMVHHRPSSTFLLLFTVFFFFTVLLLTFISPLALNYFTLSREVAPCLFQLDLTITITSKTQIIHYADLDLVMKNASLFCWKNLTMALLSKSFKPKFAIFEDQREFCSAMQ